MKKKATFTHIQIWKNMFWESVWSFFTDSGHSTLESNSHTYQELNSSGLLNIICAKWQSHSCAACSSSQCSWGLWQLQHLRCGHAAFFPGCIYTDSRTGYGPCLNRKLERFWAGPLPFCPHIVVCSLFCQLSSPAVGFCNTNHYPHITQRTTSLFPPLPWNNRLRKNIADNQAIFFSK